MTTEDCVTIQRGLRGSSALALTLAASLVGWSAARAAPPAADPGDAPVVSILDTGAKSAVAAGLQTRSRKVVVTRFSVAPGASASLKGLSSQGCPPAARAVQPPSGAAPAVALDPQILDALSAQLSKRLARRVAVATEKNADQAPPNSVVVTGCITRIEAGNATKRMVGMHMGASRLAAHVRVNEKLRTGLKPVAEFDVAVTGANLLPPLSPIGLAMHVAMMQRQTLLADAKKLGNRISYAIEDAFLPGGD